MKMKSLLGTLWMACALAIILGLSVGCGGGDDDSAEEAVPVESTGTGSTGSGDSSGGTVMTNVALTTNSNGSISFITNLVFIPPTQVTFLLLPPKQIAPANGTVFMLFPPATKQTVDFNWTDVAGADKYQISFKEANASGVSTIGFYPYTPRNWQFAKGTYTWSVYAQVDGKNQQESGNWTFEVK